MTTKTHKACLACKEIKSIEEFYLNNKPEHKKGRSWNPRCKICVNKIARDNYDPYYRKSSRIKSQYGITMADFENKLKEQNNCCAICESDKPGGNGNFYVDHNHTTGKVRGLLCHWCNFMIGQSREDINILKAGIKYLKKWEG
jgi:hypothetical protein